MSSAWLSDIRQRMRGLFYSRISALSDKELAISYSPYGTRSKTEWGAFGSASWRSLPRKQDVACCCAPTCYSLSAIHGLQRPRSGDKHIGGQDIKAGGVIIIGAGKPVDRQGSYRICVEAILAFWSLLASSMAICSCCMHRLCRAGVVP